MKHNYTKRTPILTLLTFFALALGSQWTFGQTYTFDTDVEGFTACVRAVKVEGNELKYYQTSDTGDIGIGGGAKYGVVSPEITFENGKTYQISYEHYGDAERTKGSGTTNKFAGILHPEQDYYSDGSYNCNNTSWTTAHTLINHDTESTKTSYSVTYTNNTGSDIVKPLVFRTQKMNTIHYFDNIIVQEMVSCGVSLGDASYTCGDYNEGNDNYSYTATLDVVNSDPSNAYTLSTDAGSLNTSVIPANTTTSITVTFNGTTTNSFTLSIDECATTTKDYTTTCNYMIGDGTNSFWYKDTHWTKGTIPTTTDDVIITAEMTSFSNSKDKLKNSYSAVNSFTIESGAHFRLIEANDGSHGDATINGDFTNNGTLTIDGNFEASGNITNESTININETAYISGADVTNNGTITIDGNFEASGNITNESTININETANISGADVTNNGTITINGDFDASGDITNGSTININETAYLSGDDITNNGTITIKSNATNHGNLKVNSVTTNGTVNYELHTPITVRDGAFDANDLSNVTVKVGLITAPLDGMKFGEVVDNNLDLLTAWKYNDSQGSKKLFGPYVNGAYSNFFSDGSANGDDKTNDATLITPGKGYRASLYQGKNPNNGDLTSDGLLEFTGDILTGDQSADVGSNNDGWDLIGNPYTSGLSLKAFVSENNNLLENLTTGITYWDNTLDPAAFVTKTKAELDATDGDIVIPPGQAFFVRPKTGTTSLNFKADQQQIQNGASFNRNSNALEGFNITLGNSDINKSTKVYLNNTTTLGVDKGHEAAAIGLSTKGMGIYTLIADQSTTEALAIQSIPTNSIENTTLKLGVNAGLGEHTLSLESINLPEDLNVYVTDLANGSETLLNKKVYTFNVTDAPLEGSGRFIISFQSNALSTGDNALEQLQIAAFQNTITVKGDLKNNTSLKVYDLQGRLVAKTVLSDSNRQLKLNNSTGVYVVSLSNVQGSKTQKVILK